MNILRLLTQLGWDLYYYYTENLNIDILFF